MTDPLYIIICMTYAFYDVTYLFYRIPPKISSFQMTLIIPSLKMLCLFNGVREEKQLQVHQIKVYLLIKSVQKTNSCLMSVCLSLSDTLCVSLSPCVSLAK